MNYWEVITSDLNVLGTDSEMELTVNRFVTKQQADNYSESLKHTDIMLLQEGRFVDTNSADFWSF